MKNTAKVVPFALVLALWAGAAGAQENGDNLPESMPESSPRFHCLENTV